MQDLAAARLLDLADDDREGEAAVDRLGGPDRLDRRVAERGDGARVEGQDGGAAEQEGALGGRVAVMTAARLGRRGDGERERDEDG